MKADDNRNFPIIKKTSEKKFCHSSPFRVQMLGCYLLLAISNFRTGLAPVSTLNGLPRIFQKLNWILDYYIKNHCGWKVFHSMTSYSGGRFGLKNFWCFIKLVPRKCVLSTNLFLVLFFSVVWITLRNILGKNFKLFDHARQSRLPKNLQLCQLYCALSNFNRSTSVEFFS